MTNPTTYLLIRDPIIGQSIARLVDGERMTLGRAPTNHIIIHDDRASRFHAEIFATSTGWSIRDLESRNGTLLGGEPLVSDRVLASGDMVAIGRVEILFCEGDPPTDPAGGSGVISGTSTHEIHADQDQWRASITHRRTHSGLLDDIRNTVEIMPRVGRAAAELCRLAFSLGRAVDLPAVSQLALESAIQGVGAAKGIVLLAGLASDARPDAKAGLEANGLECVAALPQSWPIGQIPQGVIAAVLASDEALLASVAPPCPKTEGNNKSNAGLKMSSISSPVRSGGKAVGVMHLEINPHDHETTPDDLEFVMAVCDTLGVAIENLTARAILSTKLATTADEIERLKRRLGDESRMVGSSAVLQAITGQIGRVASTKATVLIRGESGVGKELVARAIHDASDRKNRPFICLNCAALSETLLESELFGHEKGAFTGATERKAGKFESAHKGTLLLDEIGEMSPSIQAKFLRVLEGHPFERVGGSAPVQVDVRVVAATNRNLEEAVAAGDFRRDLYFRLKVVEILVPPLRKRPEDIEALARHFLSRFADETGRPVRTFTPEAMKAMLAYHWPGNIRELRNCIERAVVLSADDCVDAHELALSQLSSPGNTGKQASPRSGPFVPETIDEVERRHVMATLEAVGGNKTKTATILGIERSTLDRKLARWAKL
ncbi:MAG: sigma 54-interacting transcriptional regulator [Planctomycetota bacterium]